MHRGVRQGRDNLQGCVSCHASAASGSVAQAKTDFCVSCHAYAAVQIDCFECHASRPAQAVAADHEQRIDRALAGRRKFLGLAAAGAAACCSRRAST